MMSKNIINSWQWLNDNPMQIIHRDSRGMTKQAKWYIEYKSDPDHIYVSALFLGAGEFYSCNNNGDFFPEEELLRTYKSFLKGNHFKHHQNDDPEQSYGKIVDVFYNPDMHRVEGIIKIIKEKSPDMIKKIEEGKQVPLSMACKVLYDVCSICGHKSYNVKDYCEHLREQMTNILSDGKKVYAINPNPDFFDISEVIIGADPTACTFRKIASLDFDSEKIDLYTEKKALLERLASIEKKLIGMIESGDPKVEYLAKGIGKTACLNSIHGHIEHCIPVSAIYFNSIPGILSSGDGMFQTLLKQANINKYLEACDRLIDNSAFLIEKENICKQASLKEDRDTGTIANCRLNKLPITEKNIINFCKLAACNLNVVYQNQNVNKNLYVLNTIFY